MVVFYQGRTPQTYLLQLFEKHQFSCHTRMVTVHLEFHGCTLSLGEGHYDLKGGPPMVSLPTDIKYVPAL